MKYLVLTVILLQLVNLVFSVTILARDNVTSFDVYRTLELSCRVTETSPNIKVVWEKEGKPVGSIEKYAKKLKYSESAGNFTIAIMKTDDDDAGNYSCVAYENDKELSRANMLASSNIRIKMQSNLNVVQGEKLRLVCHATGKPKPIISWVIGNETYTESRGIVKLLKDDQTDTDNAILLMENINITDRGVYKCVGTSEITHKIITDETMVRIKDKYAALWPFLGICLEVFVLCAIILIYEKKRNKSELEESDTDQSPDQKNTPDHGKDSNLRHRQ